MSVCLSSRRKANRPLRAALLLAGFALPGGAVHAAVGPGMAAAEPGSALGCVRPLAPASRGFASSRVALADGGALTKSSAILGGTTSALDAIRAQQVISPLSALPRPAAFADTARLTISLPGIDTSLAPATACAPIASGTIALPLVLPSLPTVSGEGLASPLALPQPKPLGANDFLASQRVSIRHTMFDSQWKRVRGDSISKAALRRYVGGASGAGEATLSAVNAWANRRIAYVEDRDLFGVGDYWAGARKTLRLGKGDCEDIAIVKMQMLAAAGVSRDDMFLTVTRDLVRGQDHAVLIVRTDAGYRLLDNATDTVLDAGPRNDYRAIVSLGNRENWLHGA